MSPKPKTYHLPPTRLVPNSPDPVLYYPSYFTPSATPSSLSIPASALPQIHSHFTSNAWTPQWIFRYGSTQSSHYHSRTHECMVVLSGNARIRFGLADAETAQGGTRDGAGVVGASDADDDDNESEKSDDTVEIEASVGDVFVLPAGVAHKTFCTQPEAPFALLTPGTARGFSKEEAEGVEIGGFTMMGAYPRGSSEWDFMVGGEDIGRFEKVWGVDRPEMDPVLGTAREGLVGLWGERKG